ncbi:hypothetical protein I7I50_01219 [Histoplasma capsulatum G186AR]|uniref:Uncharacterized protein n=1 Tax=Ajellomyces capsulatus TaxID=5037 RepID=A0A8H8D2P2_AJECA|nr:hypothetical protein I7I52_08954 [Histoplasma capsulatum]QSS73158.1 hypothetical protein I7I50_01219 [Histoplasma capsulatum G186AR]
MREDGESEAGARLHRGASTKKRERRGCCFAVFILIFPFRSIFPLAPENLKETIRAEACSAGTSAELRVDHHHSLHLWD